jgi:hypothetical protein
MTSLPVPAGRLGYDSLSELALDQRWEKVDSEACFLLLMLLCDGSWIDMNNNNNGRKMTHEDLESICA